MFRLQRHKSEKSGERIDFKFSSFQALQVPKEWDKLFVSIISMETGKTIAKSSKASTRNGVCHWKESISESVWVLQEDTSKEIEECMFKIVVAMGSARSGILGEAIINLTNYMSSKKSVSISLPLKRCSHGTVLQVKIQCLNPRTTIRDEQWLQKSPHSEDKSEDYEDVDNKSDVSDNAYAKSIGSSSSKTSHPGELGSRNTSFSASGSRHSFDSLEGSLDRTIVSPRNNISGDLYSPVVRQDSSNSQNGAPYTSGVENLPRSNYSSFNSKYTGSGTNLQQNSSHLLSPSVERNGCNSKNLLEEAEDTIEELRSEAKMWERNARKLMIDLELLRKEFSDQSRRQADLDMELSAACSERDGLKQEIEQLRTVIEEAQMASETSIFQTDGINYIQKELEEEIKFHKESNANLTINLKKSQESNMELVSILQELEETIEKQRLEVDNFSDEKAQLYELQKSQKDLQDTVNFLEEELDDKSTELLLERNRSNQALLEIEAKWTSKISEKEELVNLEAKLSGSKEIRFDYGGDSNMIKENEVLKEKVQELERDCNELTDENLNLILKLKGSNGETSFNSSSNELQESEIELLKLQICHLEQRLESEMLNEGVSVSNQLIDLQNKCTDLDTLLRNSQVEIREREAEITTLKQQLEDGYGRKAEKSEIVELEAKLSSKNEEIEILKHSQMELRALVYSLQKEKDQVDENFDIVSRESAITSKCLDDVRNDLLVLTCSLDTHISANKMLERKSFELESGKHELELHLSEMEEENVQLSERISGFEAQLRYLTDEKESCRLELDNSNSTTLNLRNKIERLGNDMETQRVELKQKLQEMQDRWSETQEECEYLKRANPQLQATAECLIEECSSVQKLNGELKKQKLELNERCTRLEAELRESRESFSNICKSAEIFEAKLSSMEKNIALKEKFLTSELDSLLLENEKHKEKLVLGESLLHQMYLEKSLEVENLQREVAHLSEQISATHDEREIKASNAILEVSSLHADKVKLESALQDEQAKVKLFETEMHNIQLESGNKLQRLITELSASKQNQELLVADHEKLQRLLDDVKASEERLKITFNGLELKLSASEYERKQLSEEISILKIQLQKVVQLQDEVLALKNFINESKYEKGKLESSLQSLSKECEELRAEKMSFVEKISNTNKSVSELEDCKRIRFSLEEKLLRLEGDLTAKKVLHAQDPELKNELNRIKRANSQFQRKIQCLEEEKDECLKRVEALEQELKNEEKRHLSSSGNNELPRFESDTQEDLMPSEKEMEKSNYQENENKSTSVKTNQLQKFPNGQENLGANHNQETDKKRHDHNGRDQALELMSKIQLLEIELSEALEANNMYKLQLKNVLTEGPNGRANAPKRSVSEGVERGASSLEAELKDLQERYFHMSLRFAEVEAQREELVMKVKALKPNGKRWFS
ncbi:hypothetical protein GIB67_005774 [Kingdonia uniflora]|uniref:C2 NT-type domain-containing protein n=1 Tax=Kingdonia uniflora TaxID=39325 RepID=A0A7J7KVP7_9MAGN|nr:hypothetical protein GIB67_005774 [Kingdonia uniflora]